MFALIAAIVWFLHGLGVLENSDNVEWLRIGLGFFALHFAFGWPVAWPPANRT